MRRRMFVTFMAVALFAGSPVGVAARADDTAQACAASLAVLRSYTKDAHRLAILDSRGGQVRSIPAKWKDAPSEELARRWAAETGRSFMATCASGPGAFAGLGVVDQKDPDVVGYLSLDLATLGDNGREALVEAGYVNKGFGGHCALYHLRRDANGWRIVDERATCVI